MSHNAEDVIPTSEADGRQDRPEPPMAGSKLASMLGSKRKAVSPSSPECHQAEESAKQDAPMLGSHLTPYLSRKRLFEERARQMGEKCGVIINTPDLFPGTSRERQTVLRVDKPIRMRVRRICHKCNTTFSVKSECAKCRHVRCDKCPRHPPRHGQASASIDKKAQAVDKVNQDESAIVADSPCDDDKTELRRPSKTGGQDLVHRTPRQRVRRNCHQCHALFALHSKKCEQCNHIRCTECPRDPPKKDKYPVGYPGDVFGLDSEPQFECNYCETLYPLGAYDGTPCGQCGLQKSRDSPRAVPRKVQPAPDQTLVNKINERVKAADMLSSSSSAS